ncbi:MAG: glycoside hydrolase, partial [Flavobacteriales bacterium 32-34-25]
MKIKTILYSVSLLTAVVSCKTAAVKDTVSTQNQPSLKMNNPIITDKYTADPAAIVYKDKVYLYAGHDVPPKDVNSYRMNEWLVYSSSDMVNWEEHSVPLKPTDFAWAKGDAWAGQVIERNGKFYWYVTVSHGSIHGKSIGIAVS